MTKAGVRIQTVRILVLTLSACTVGTVAGPAIGPAYQLPVPALGCPNSSPVSLKKAEGPLQDKSPKEIDTAIPSLKLGIEGLPCDAGIEADKTLPLKNRLQDAFDYFSWLTFIALNSPGDGGSIGKDAQTVWEGWKQLPDVMRKPAVEPSRWTPRNLLTDDEVPADCRGKYQDRMMIIHMEAEETYNEPFKSGPLFDQNGNYALFVILMNKAMFDYIVANRFYSIEGQQQSAGESIDFPSGDGSGPGSVMVKASWKILTGNDDRKAYHTIKGLLYLPKAANPCRAVDLGLIGFHVGHKTATRRQWIWSTFEHKDNVPTLADLKKPKLSGPYNFYNVDDKDPSHVNQVPDGPWDPLKMSPPWDPDHPSSFKSQIVRTGAFGPDFDDVGVLNAVFQKYLQGTVWANYELITTQWPSDSGCARQTDFDTLPDSTCVPFPPFLANSTLETFSQSMPVARNGVALASSSSVPLATSSCISCHNNATTQHIPATRSDFTYILEKACFANPEKNQLKENCKHE